MPFCSFNPPTPPPRRPSHLQLQHSFSNTPGNATTVAPRRRCGFAARVSLWQLFRPRKEADGGEAGRAGAGALTDLHRRVPPLSEQRSVVVAPLRAGGGRALARNFQRNTSVDTRAFWRSFGFPSQRDQSMVFYVEHLLPRLLPICFTFIYNPGRI